MNRQHKIALLRAIQQGRISISSLRPRSMMIMVGVDEPTRYFLDSEQVSQEKYLDYLYSRPSFRTGRLDVQVDLVDY